MAITLRKTIFLSSILTNSEVWYGLTKNDIEEIESVDRLLLRRILGCQISTCKEALYLETGSLSVETIIKSRRIKFLHFILNLDDSGILSKFFRAQLAYPVKNDWTIQVKQDLNDFEIKETLIELKKLSKEQITKLVKIKSHQYELKKLNKTSGIFEAKYNDSRGSKISF